MKSSYLESLQYIVHERVQKLIRLWDGKIDYFPHGEFEVNDDINSLTLDVIIEVGNLAAGRILAYPPRNTDFHICGVFGGDFKNFLITFWVFRVEFLNILGGVFDGVFGGVFQKGGGEFGGVFGGEWDRVFTKRKKCIFFF